MTRFIFIRHGQSIANAQRRFAGHSDFDLSDIGKQQAQLTADYISKNEKIDVIYSSDLKRAYNTAVPTAAALGMEIIPHLGFREIFAGDWEGMTTDDIEVKYTADFDVWKNDYAFSRCTGGESTAEVYERAVAATLELARRHDGQCVLVSTHATPIRALTAYSQGLSKERVGEVPFPCNASLNVFTVEDGILRAERTNITEHLGDIITGVHRSFGK